MRSCAPGSGLGRRFASRGGIQLGGVPARSGAVKDGEETSRLDQRFFVLGLGDGIGDNPSASMEIGAAPQDERCPDEDAQLAFPVKTQITQSARVRSAR